eukprot:m.87128 g.87128  ORF g.87128 m.87128 type:complete len:262 (-) comp13090_c0_seq2:1520-2305(-)
MMAAASVLAAVRTFYKSSAAAHIKESHGLKHVLAVYNHAMKAVDCCEPPLQQETATEILAAALLHDVDDRKYFPAQCKGEYRNARNIMSDALLSKDSQDNVLRLIDLVSCSSNGNSVPDDITESKSYHLLIPRWSDRIEAVGKIGVVRCYQYCQEKGDPLCSANSPRATMEEEVWKYATPERFEEYQRSGGASSDMISHYYDKLLHVACPPTDIVRNRYLEEKLKASATELLEVCLRFGRTGQVDIDYILQLERECNSIPL